MTSKIGECTPLSMDEQHARVRAIRANRLFLRAVASAACAVVALLLTATGTAPAHATTAMDSIILASKTSPRRATTTARVVDRLPARTNAAVVTASTAGPGQAGYVHYFVITGPDGEPESQVGIELPGDLIAWSFPELGVVVSPFIASGAVSANGKSYDVEHLYGIRPFREDESMRILQRDLAERVRMWVEEKTPYCDEERPSNARCLSCLGFVLRVLYPGPSRTFSALPADFKSARKNVYTTEDFLLYLADVPRDAPRAARLKRIEALAVPDDMREQLVRVASTEPAKPTVAKPRSAARSMVQLPKRAIPRRGS